MSNLGSVPVEEAFENPVVEIAKSNSCEAVSSETSKAASLVWDNSGDLKSPLKDVSSFFDLQLSQIDDKSETIKSFDNLATIRATEERNEANILDLPEEEPVTMAPLDNDEYARRNQTLERQVRGARRKIGEYTSAEVMLIDCNTFKDNLAAIRNSVNEVIEEIDAFIEELGDPADAPRKQKWSTEMRNLIAELKTNERDVKQTMTDLILRNHENAEAVAQVPVLAHGQGQGQQLSQ